MGFVLYKIISDQKFNQLIKFKLASVRSDNDQCYVSQ